VTYEDELSKRFPALLMDKILSNAKRIEMENEKSFSWKKPSKRRQAYYRKEVKQRIVEKVDKEEQELEFRRKQLEQYLSELRAIHEPDESLDIIEDFIEHFEPRNKEEELMASSVMKQLERVQEMRNK
jgi:N-acetyl-anhydromuramyl-L-alanine amidase AmpD